MASKSKKSSLKTGSNTTRPATLPMTAARTPVASALARLSRQPLLARPREESPDSPITGSGEINGVSVRFVVIPPGEELPEEFAGFFKLHVEMDYGYRLAIVSLGLSDRTLANLDWANGVLEGIGVPTLDHESFERSRMDGIVGID